MSLTRVFSLQVNDFLSGAAPLNLTMRLGDHMMLIQVREMMMIVMMMMMMMMVMIMILTVPCCSSSSPP